MEERKKVVYNKIGNDVRARGKKVEFISYSQLDKFVSCKRCYKYQYVDKIKPKFVGNFYSGIGTICHELIEDCYVNNYTKEDIIREYKIRVRKLCDKYNVELDLPIIKSLYNFFTESTTLVKLMDKNNLKVEFEVPVSMQLKYNVKSNIEYWLIGFIDLVITDKEGNVDIFDFKTSNKASFSGKGLDKSLLQLYTYAYMYELNYNKKVNKVGYLLLKYVEFNYVNKKYKKEKNSTYTKVERKDIQDKIMEVGSDNFINIEDTLLDFEYTKDVKLDYLKRLVTLFVSAKTENKFEATNRDNHFCNNFCDFRSEICDWVDELEPQESPMSIMLNSVLRKNG